MADGKSKVAVSAARSLSKNPLLLLRTNVKTLTTAVGGLLSLPNFILPNTPINQAGKELSPSVTTLLNLAQPVIAQANPGSDLSFEFGKVDPTNLFSDSESSNTFDNFSLFLEAASTFVPLAAGLRRRSGSSSSSASSSSTSDIDESSKFKFDIPSASHHIYFPKFRAKNHLWHLPNLYKATSDVVEAVWRLYYKSASSSEFQREVAAANQIIQEALTGYVSSSGDKSIDPKYYSQVRTGHFLAIRTALESVTDRLNQIRGGEYNSKRTLNIIQGCGQQLLRIEKVSQQVASDSGAISDFVFDRIRYLVFSFFVLDVEKALAILHNLQYALVQPTKLYVASFLFTLYETIEQHIFSPTVLFGFRKCRV